jgi:hypothetical protein
MIVTYLSLPPRSCARLRSARVITSKAYPATWDPHWLTIGIAIIGPQSSGPVIETSFAMTVQSLDRIMIRVYADLISVRAPITGSPAATSRAFDIAVHKSTTVGCLSAPHLLASTGFMSSWAMDGPCLLKE